MMNALMRSDPGVMDRVEKELPAHQPSHSDESPAAAAQPAATQLVNELKSHEARSSLGFKLRFLATDD